MAKKIVGVFDSEQEAMRAIEDLKQQGFSSDDISIIAKNRDDVSSITENTGTEMTEDIAAGAATGGVIGGATGLIAGLAALSIPGIGMILAAGPIAAALTGAAVGAGAGGLIAGLIDMGISEEEAGEYDTHFNSGKILVLVDSDSVKGDAVHDILRTNRSLDINRNEHNTADLIGGHHDTRGVLGLGKTGVMERTSNEPNVWKLSGMAQGGMERTDRPMTENGKPLTLHPEETAEDQDGVEVDQAWKSRQREEQSHVSNHPFKKDQF